MAAAQLGSGFRAACTLCWRLQLGGVGCSLGRVHAGSLAGVKQMIQSLQGSKCTHSAPQLGRAAGMPILCAATAPAPSPRQGTVQCHRGQTSGAVRRLRAECWPAVSLPSPGVLPAPRKAASRRHLGRAPTV